MNNFVIENEQFALTLREDSIAVSLIHKQTGIECLDTDNLMPAFSLTEQRPFDNNIKLAHPNKFMTFASNHLIQEKDTLVCGFEMINAIAKIKLKITPEYIGFELKEIVGDGHGLCMDFPPVYEFCFLQLPVKKRKNFGEWLNVAWDDDVAINVIGTCPFTKIDAQNCEGCNIMTAQATSDVKLIGCTAALIVSASGELLDIIEKIEADFGLPNGVKSRRGDMLNRSCYWTENINPGNVDRHIEYARRAGLTTMLIYYRSMFAGGTDYETTGSFKYQKSYPNGIADLKAMIKKLNDAGILVGLHILHTHIGFATKYVVPSADHRLRLKRYFTLARPIDPNDTTIYVEEPTHLAPVHNRCKILRFGGEIIKYESVTADPPSFTGCIRGYLGTDATLHEKGQIGGVLDVSEFSATSCYIDQNSSLQDEIADEIAKVYSAGFDFLYFDGSEGTNPPFEIYIPYAQYRVYKKLDREPLFCEGAAKSHFSWHMLSGGNAFDAFDTESFKLCTDLHPLAEAVRMKQDFTRLNFGWWMFREDTQADIFEYGTSHAAAFDCPGTMMENLALFEKNKRSDDILEVLRRWEHVRIHKLLTDEQKEMLKRPEHEHTLLINESGEYELVECFEIRNDSDISVFLFERGDCCYLSIWHKTDSCELALNLAVNDITYFDDFGKENIKLSQNEMGTILPVSKKRYAKITRPRSEVIEAVRSAIIL